MEHGDLCVATFLSVSQHRETQPSIYSEPITVAMESDLAGYRFISVQRQPTTSSTFTLLCTPLCRAVGFLPFFQSILPVGHTEGSSTPLCFRRYHTICVFTCEYLGPLICITISCSIQSILQSLKWKGTGQLSMTEWFAATTEHTANTSPSRKKKILVKNQQSKTSFLDT